MLICRQNNNFILNFFLQISQRYCKLVILCTSGMPGYAHPKWQYQLVVNFRVYLQAKYQLYPPHFSGDIEKIWKLILILINIFQTCLVTHTQNDSINLQKTLMFVDMPTINFIIHFFLEILYFKESCNLIGQYHFGP